MITYKIEYSNGAELFLQNYDLPFSEYRSQAHNHHWLEISILKSGRGVYQVEDRYYDMQKGDLFLFNNIEIHGIKRIDRPEPMQNMVIHFDPSFVYYSQDDFFDYRFLNIFFERADSFENRLDRDNPQTKQIGNLLLEIEKEFVEQQEGFELAIKVHLLNILVILMRYFGYTSAEPSHYLSHKTSLDSIRTVVKYINTYFAEEIYLEQLAKMVNMNPSYLSTLFSKYNGINIRTYLCKTRVNRAKEYLKSTDASILEIATQCGFNNSSNFNQWHFPFRLSKTVSDSWSVDFLYTYFLESCRISV